MVGIEGVHSRDSASGTVTSLTNDRIEAGGSVVLAEDEVLVVGPGVLLEAEAVGDDGLVGYESEATLDGCLARGSLVVGDLRTVGDASTNDLIGSVALCETSQC